LIDSTSFSSRLCRKEKIKIPDWQYFLIKINTKFSPGESIFSPKLIFSTGTGNARP
jgi:hypothetical protein